MGGEGGFQFRCKWYSNARHSNARLLWILQLNKFNKATNLFYKTPENLSCTDVFVTNRPQSFCNSYAIETELSDFHTMTVSVMKIHYRKHSPKIINYRD